jgi:hypothetical protein
MRWFQFWGGLLAAILVTGCATTQVKDSWSNPAAGKIEFRKVVALAIAGDEALRRSLEDALVRAAPRENVVAAYTFVPQNEIRDTEAIKRRVTEAGFDGAVIFRVVGAEERQTYVPGSYASPYYSTWGYYGYGWNTMATPGYVRTDTYVDVETMVYSIADDQLVWAGRSESLNPSSAPALVDDVVKAVAADLRKKGLID